MNQNRCSRSPEYAGPEYLSSQLVEWAAHNQIQLTYIQPGKPKQNAYVEQFNRTVRHEWPNMALGGIPPCHKLQKAA